MLKDEIETESMKKRTRKNIMSQPSLTTKSMTRVMRLK